MLLSDILFFFAGVILLWQGAEILVRGSSKLALRIGVRPLVVGLTIIAMGTSAPEFAVSMLSALRHTNDIALGNIIGSNIANIGLVIGITALIRPLKIEVTTVRREMPFLIVATAVFYLLSLDKKLSFIDGLILLTGFMVFLGYMFRMASQQRKDGKKLRAEMEENENETKRRPIKRYFAMIFAGLAGLLLGSYWLVNSAVVIAETLGVSQVVIGITMVAVGTSLPELAISAVGAVRGHIDIAVGNAVGSNIFNTLFVIAAVSMVTTIRVDVHLLHFEYLVMLGFTLISFPLMRTGYKLNRPEALALLSGYSIFIAMLFVF